MMSRKNSLKNEYGVSLVLVALLIFLLFGFTALAIDVGHLYVVRNELGNAADAGALAGASVLYINQGKTINPDARAIARDAARGLPAQQNSIPNRSENSLVEVYLDMLDPVTGYRDVEIGHWSFGSRSFTKILNPQVLDLWNYTAKQLDGMTNFVNAVRVATRRQSSPSIISYFAGLFGFSEFTMQQSAVAWIGYAGSIGPNKVSQPIAICKQSIVNPGTGILECNAGRMTNSNDKTAETFNTAAWTDYIQPSSSNCGGGANANEVRGLVCEGNPKAIEYGKNVLTQGGQAETVIKDKTQGLYKCWQDSTKVGGIPKRKLWPQTLLVIDCGDGKNPGPCSKVVGVVAINIAWMTDNSSISQPKNWDVPTVMYDAAGTNVLWFSNEPNNEQRFNSTTGNSGFVNSFQLKNPSNTGLATYAKNTIYFLPACEEREPEGTSVGENYGILAKIPVLVK